MTTNNRQPLGRSLNANNEGYLLRLPSSTITKTKITGKFLKKLFAQYGMTLSTPLYFPRGKKQVPVLYSTLEYMGIGIELTSSLNFTELGNNILKGEMLTISVTMSEDFNGFVYEAIMDTERTTIFAKDMSVGC